MSRRDRISDEAFDRIVKVAKAAGHRPTSAEQKAACAPLISLDDDEKVAAVLRFVERNSRLQEHGEGDWVAWVFVDGVIGGRAKLPFARDEIEAILEGVIVEPRPVPPEHVARWLERFVAENGPPDARLKRLIARAAKSMWPDDDAEGASFRKAAARLRALIA
jgi:hypothetical protein